MRNDVPAPSYPLIKIMTFLLMCCKMAVNDPIHVNIRDLYETLPGMTCSPFEG